MDTFQLGGFGGGEQLSGLLQRLVQPAGAKVIRPSLEHGKLKLHRHGQCAQHVREQRQIFFGELLLQIDRVRGDDGFFPVRHREQDGGNQVGQ